MASFSKAATAGFNLPTFGFGGAISAAAFDAEFPASRLRSLRAIGFDHARLTVEPKEFLKAGPKGFAALWAGVDHAVSAINGSGLLCIVDNHVGGAAEGGWTSADIEQDPVKMAGIVDFLGSASKALLARDPTKVCLEQWNETTIQPGCGWPAIAQRLSRAIRAANPGITILVSPADWADIGSVGELILLDGGCAVAVHIYDPRMFCNQAVAGTDGAPVRAGLRFPAVEAQRAAWLTGMNADYQGYLGGYFDGAKDSWAFVKSVLQPLLDWGKANGVTRDRMRVTEYGVSAEAPEESRLAWKAAFAKLFQESGIARTSWVVQTGDPFDIGAGSYLPTPAMRSALRLTPAA